MNRRVIYAPLTLLVAAFGEPFVPPPAQGVQSPHVGGRGGSYLGLQIDYAAIHLISRSRSQAVRSSSGSGRCKRRSVRRHTCILRDEAYIVYLCGKTHQERERESTRLQTKHAFLTEGMCGAAQTTRTGLLAKLL